MLNVIMMNVIIMWAMEWAVVMNLTPPVALFGEIDLITNCFPALFVEKNPERLTRKRAETGTFLGVQTTIA
jgi:hypothetical protein